MNSNDWLKKYYPKFACDVPIEDALDHSLQKWGGFSCADRRNEEDRSPWASWRQHRDPEPMIFWLKKAKEMSK